MSDEKTLYDLMRERLKTNLDGARAIERHALFRQSEVDEVIDLLEKKEEQNEELNAAERFALIVLMVDARLDP